MDKQELQKLRHSAAHIMAAAVQKIYPDAKFDIGPGTDEGFYYEGYYCVEYQQVAMGGGISLYQPDSFGFMHIFRSVYIRYTSHWECGKYHWYFIPGN